MTLSNLNRIWSIISSCGFSFCFILVIAASFEIGGWSDLLIGFDLIFVLPFILIGISCIINEESERASSNILALSLGILFIGSSMIIPFVDEEFVVAPVIIFCVSLMSFAMRKFSRARTLALNILTTPILVFISLAIMKNFY